MSKTIKIGQSSPSVSVVIPAYNEEAIIGDCLASLTLQTVKPYEIIVVDNNSSDQTAVIARSFPGVKVITESQQGIAYARNAGFNAATGDIIARIDADVLVAKNWVETIVRELERQPRVIGVTGSSDFYDHPFGSIASRVFAFYHQYSDYFINGQPILWGSNMAFRRKYWPKVANEVINDSRVWEDVDLSVRLSRYGRARYVGGLHVQSSARSVIGDVSQMYAYVRFLPRSYAQFNRWRRFASWMVFFSLFAFLPLAPFMSAQFRRVAKRYLPVRSHQSGRL